MAEIGGHLSLVGNVIPGINLVAIQSVRFPNAFLRIDGSNVTQPQGSGGGVVNCQFYDTGATPVPGIWNNEVFELISLGDPANNYFAIRSLRYPGAFLRIDGSQVNEYQGSGSGIVNSQFYSSGSYPNQGSDPLLGPIPGDTPLNYEWFQITSISYQSNNPVFIQSMAFPHAFLRIDGSNVTEPQGAGSGIVNCQYYSNNPPAPGSYELFNLLFFQTFPVE